MAAEAGTAGGRDLDGEAVGRPRIGVSACLLGEEVRYNGGHSRDRFLTADHTDAMARLPLPAGPAAPDGLDAYVFKARSPSCGIHGIPRYAASGQPADRNGRGLYADRVIRAFPLLAVEDEGRLNDAGLREAFVERAFAAARLRRLLSGPWRPRDLVEFHARHKLQ